MSITCRKIRIIDGIELRLQEKNEDGRIFVDLRIWKKWAHSDDFRPSRNGLMVEKIYFRQGIDYLNDILKD